MTALEGLGYLPEAVDPSRCDKTYLSRERFDVAFVALHGKGGEDGVLQASLDRKKIPYTGSNGLGCRLSFDKGKTKSLLRRNGIPTPDYTIIGSEEAWEQKLARFKVPFFVKPLDDGSSIGVFCVEDLTKSHGAIKKAVKKYGRLLIERKISGREFTVAVFDGEPLPVIELRPKRKFYDYKAKYTKGLCRYLVPAPVEAALARKMQSLAVRVHESLKLRDVSRVDIMMDGKEQVYILEANAIPGMTEMSLLPKAAREYGIPFDRLCERLIQKAFSRSVLQKGRRQELTGV